MRDKEQDNFKKTLDNWAKNNSETAETNIVEGLFIGAMDASPIIDKFSTWLLAGTGITAALMITNLNKLVPLLSYTILKQSIYILIILALFGFLAKYKAIFCQIMLATEKEMKKRVMAAVDEYEKTENEIIEMAEGHELEVITDLDITVVYKEYCKAFPKIMHKSLLNQFVQGFDDRLAASRKAANSLFWQGNYTVLQFFIFLYFIIFTITHINN